MSTLNIKTAVAGDALTIAGKDLRRIKYVSTKDINRKANADGTMPEAAQNSVFTYQGAVLNVRSTAANSADASRLIEACKNGQWAGIGEIGLTINTYSRPMRDNQGNTVEVDGVEQTEDVNGLTLDYIADSSDLRAEALGAATFEAEMELVKRKVLGTVKAEDLAIA